MPTLNVQNRTLFHGDNLPFLRGINSGTIHLIATDPPFNKGRDFHATPDSLAAGAKFEDRWSWDKDVHQDWIDAIQDDWPAVWEVIDAARAAAGEDMAAYLCWLGVRLLEMRRVLRDDGSIYLHIDHTAHAWVKTLMDAIFGRKNFRNEIVWCYTGPGSPGMRQFNRKHDTILWYSVSDQWCFNADEVRIGHHIKTKDNFKTGLRGSGFIEGSYGLAAGGKVPETWWIQEKGNGLAIAARQKKQYMGYPTQKPLALYERIIKASSNPGDLVLDPFCGCATTPIAAERLGRKWVGMDIWDKAHQTVIERLQREGLAAPDGDSAGRLITFGQIFYSTAPPIRSDDGETAAPVLKTKQKIAEPPGPKMSRAEMVEFLIEQNGMVCRGCDREFDDPLYLELDHNTPRSDGGLNHISNRLLLCGPCNRIKSNRLTLSGLRAENAKRGRMAETGGQ
ncbi:MAG: DNA methyltransferase [Chloroflexi bacterium]|nr:DNA methyltransferase [Chloroflexota bacterium]